MKNVFTLLLLALFPLMASAQKDKSEKGMGAYLFTFFNDPTHSLFMAVSYDGYTFTAVNDGQPVIAGDTIVDRGLQGEELTHLVEKLVANKQ